MKVNRHALCLGCYDRKTLYELDRPDNKFNKKVLVEEVVAKISVTLMDPQNHTIHFQHIYGFLTRYSYSCHQILNDVFSWHYLRYCPK